MGTAHTHTHTLVSTQHGHTGDEVEAAGSYFGSCVAIKRKRRGERTGVGVIVVGHVAISRRWSWYASRHLIPLLLYILAGIDRYRDAASTHEELQEGAKQRWTAGMRRGSREVHGAMVVVTTHGRHAWREP